MKTPHQITMSCLRELVIAWDELYTIEEIWHDEAKLRLLLSSYELLKGQGVIPEEVMEYYSRVFMRDIWEYG